MKTTPPSVERVLVAIDVNNVFRAGQEQFGTRSRVNFKKLINSIRQKVLCGLPRELTVVAYTITPNFKIQKDGVVKQVKPQNKAFLDHLERLGVEIKDRGTYIEEKGNNYHRNIVIDWDVGITLDAVNQLNSFDTFTLVMGNGDYALLIDDLKERGKYTEIVTFEQSISRILCAAAHRTILISDQEMFRKEFVHGKTAPKTDPGEDQTDAGNLKEENTCRKEETRRVEPEE